MNYNKLINPLDAIAIIEVPEPFLPEKKEQVLAFLAAVVLILSILSFYFFIKKWNKILKPKPYLSNGQQV